VALIRVVPDFYRSQYVQCPDGPVLTGLQHLQSAAADAIHGGRNTPTLRYSNFISRARGQLARRSPRVAQPSAQSRPRDLSSVATPGPWHTLNVGLASEARSTGDTRGEGGSEATLPKVESSRNELGTTMTGQRLGLTSAKPRRSS